MQTSKAQQLANVLASPSLSRQPNVRRSGVDKSKLASSVPRIIDCTMDDDLNQSQTLDLQSTQLVEDEEPLLEDDDDSAEEAFNAEAEEIFLEKLDAWFADYAPKLFDLGLAKFLSKQNKQKKKSDDESSETSRRRPAKKRRA